MDGTIMHLPPDLIVGPSADFLPAAGEANWGMATFGVDALRAAATRREVVAAIIDTGVDQRHPLLAHCRAAKDFTGSPIGSADRNEHGTHCSGTVAASDPRIGVYDRGPFVHGKALSDGGSGAVTWIAAAMRWCASQGAEVVSMSLGSSGPDGYTDAAGKELAAAGVWVVAAAGNSGGNTPDVDFPGRFPWAISVAALNPDRTPASFTNRGAKIDTAGPGVGIWSTRPGGGFRQMSGTSMATPFVAGVLTLYRQALKERGLPIPTTEQLRQLLARRSTDTHTPGDDLRTGPGWITPLLLSLSLTPDPAPVTP